MSRELTQEEQIAAFLKFDVQTRQLIVDISAYLTPNRIVVRKVEKSDQYYKPNKIMLSVCKASRTTIEALQGNSRRRETCWARYIMMYLLRAQGYSLKGIGALLGDRNHTTVMHGIDKHIELIDKKIAYQNTFNKAMANLTEKRFTRVFAT